jgi:ring-1,2-phenylacetyl-CoA epoxidase subunit PaaC
MNKQEALYNYVLRLGDNSLVLGHRLGELCSKGPILEEDLALTNMALDHIGRAQAFLNYAAQVEGKNKTADDLAYKRGERSFYNNLIMELPDKNFADTIARQLLVSTFEYFLYTELMKSKDETIAAISAKAVKEVRYHLAHSSDWTCRLGEGTEVSHEKIQKAFKDLWMFTDELFEMNDVDELLIKEGIAIDLNSIKQQWFNHVKEVLEEATLILFSSDFMQTGSRKGIHTEHLGHLLSEMQYLQRAYPTAQW